LDFVKKEIKGSPELCVEILESLGWAISEWREPVQPPE
jgi:hypothetical protein